MCNNDSFNDTDEFISLYSFKNVTKTYNDQLQKLLNEKTTPDINDLSGLYNANEAYNAPNLQTSVNISRINQIEDRASDDSVEIIVVKSRGTRRSERLKRKIQSTAPPVQDTTLDNCENLPNKRKSRRKNLSKSKNKLEKQKAESTEIILDESTDASSNADEEELNPEVSVKIIWKSITIKKFLVRKFQKLSKIYEELSKEEDIPENRISLTFKNVRVNHNDTPSSLDLKVFDFLEGGILIESTDGLEIENSENINYDDSNSVVLQFQDSSKKIIKLSLNKSEKVQVAMIKYSEQLEIPLSNIKFYFDGELLNPSTTPETLGLENDDIIDIEVLGS